MRSVRMIKDGVQEFAFDFVGDVICPVNASMVAENIIIGAVFSCDIYVTADGTPVIFSHTGASCFPSLPSFEKLQDMCREYSIANRNHPCMIRDIMNEDGYWTHLDCSPFEQHLSDSLDRKTYILVLCQ